MQRRTFLATLGTVAASSAGVMGTGAFTSVTAERSVEVSVVADENAFLAIDRYEGPNGNYMVKHEDGTWGLYLNGESSPPGEGLNPHSHYRIKNIFTIRNQGTQPVAVWLDPPGTGDHGRRFNWTNGGSGGSGGGKGGGGEGGHEDHDDSSQEGGQDHGSHDGGPGNSTFKPGRDFKFLNETGAGEDTGNGRGHDPLDPIRCGTELSVGEEVVVGLDITIPGDGDDIGDALDDERTFHASADPPNWLTEPPQ